MKQYFIVVVLVMSWSVNCWAVSIGDLLNAAERQPGYEVSALSVQENSLQKEHATAALFPKLGVFGRFESYNSPTNLRPMPPTEVNVQAGDSLPFSREILRYGLNFDAPVYVRELYVLRQKAMLLREKAETDRQLDLIGRQASVVSLDSALIYLQALEKAIDARRTSLGKSLEDMSLKVKTGRSPDSERLKIQKTLNDLDQQRNELDMKSLDTLREIQALTGIALTEPADMSLIATTGRGLLPPGNRRAIQSRRRPEGRRTPAGGPMAHVVGYRALFPAMTEKRTIPTAIFTGAITKLPWY